MEPITLLLHCLFLVFISYLIKEAVAFNFIRTKVYRYLDIKSMNSTVVGWLADKARYWLGCHICQSFAFSIILSIFGVFPIFAPITYPMAVAILYKNIK